MKIDEGFEQTIKSGSTVLEDLKVLFKYLIDSAKPEIVTLIKQLSTAKDLVVIKEENLTLTILTKAIMENRVANSNQVVVLKNVKGDNYVVSFSYAKDKNLLPVSDNKHVVIISKTLDEALIKMFGDKDLIVLR